MWIVGTSTWPKSCLGTNVGSKLVQSQGSRVDSAVTFIDEGGEFDHFWKGLVLIMHGVHGSVALWLCGMGGAGGRRCI
jgi:hypothetical protein